MVEYHCIYLHSKAMGKIALDGLLPTISCRNSGNLSLFNNTIKGFVKEGNT